MDVKEAYKLIDSIVAKGFLSEKISVGGHSFVLKNITDKEYGLLKDIYPDEKSSETFLRKLCYCIVFLDDINFLVRRKGGFFDVTSLLRKFPEPAIRRLLKAVNALNEVYIEAIDFLEGFCYTPRSRYLWRVLDPYNRDAFTGIEGSNIVGLNSVQENWIAINKKLDEEEDYGKQFNMALMITSSNNHKSAKKISRNYDFHKKELDELRQEIAKYGYNKRRVEEQQRKAQWTPPINSREDLVRELYKQMRGEKDRHDIFIEQWIEKQRQKAEEAKKKAEQRQQDFRKKIEEIDDLEREDSRPVSAEEIKKIMEERKNKKSENYMAAYEKSDQAERFMKKVSSRVIGPSRN
jgi:hypothetical protein